MDARSTLARLVEERNSSFGELSRLLGRNPAYIQQFVRRGTPRRLDERDRHILARFLGIDEVLLGAPEDSGAVTKQTAGERPHAPRWRTSIVAVPRLTLGASAGPGSLDGQEQRAGTLSFDQRWLRDLGAQPEGLSIIRVDGESMAPTLGDGDEIMVDRSDGSDRLRDGIYVLRMSDVLMVKRVARGPRRDRFSVRSDNPLYPSWDDVDPASVQIIGRVVWTGRRVH
jgi:phage repressor protein C with HTH and peptisase S24 domain